MWGMALFRDIFLSMLLALPATARDKDVSMDLSRMSQKCAVSVPVPVSAVDLASQEKPRIFKRNNERYDEFRPRLSNPIIAQILNCFEPALLESHLAFARERLMSFYSGEWPKGEGYESEALAELIAIRQAFLIFSQATPLASRRSGEAETESANTTGIGYDCVAQTRTVTDFVEWLDRLKVLHYFEPIKALYGQTTIHFRAPLRLRSNGRVFLVDAWNYDSDGGPTLYSTDQFDLK